MSTPAPHRRSNLFIKGSTRECLIGLSISYQRDELLARGFGLEHLRELLLNLARPLLRDGANLAFGGHWNDVPENFTYDLLRLISSEQEDNSLGGPDTNRAIGRLINHSPWPDYLAITTGTEAQWIDCCRIVRVSQRTTGIAEDDCVADAEARSSSARRLYNAALCLSRMRRIAMEGASIEIPGWTPEWIPPVRARILLGGKITGFHGFQPGLFEEALYTLKHQRPLYLLGGFGGAAGVLARAILDTAAAPEFDWDWHQAKTPAVARLDEWINRWGLPSGFTHPQQQLTELRGCLDTARANPESVLNTGLEQHELEELMTTTDMRRAVNLVRKGLESQTDTLSGYISFQPVPILP